MLWGAMCFEREAAGFGLPPLCPWSLGVLIVVVVVVQGVRAVERALAVTGRLRVRPVNLLSRLGLLPRERGAGA